MKLVNVPYGLSEIKAYYGNPDANGDLEVDKKWREENIRIFTLPYPLRLSWNIHQTINKFAAHKKIGAVIVDAMEEIGDYKGGAYLDRNGYNRFGGVFNPRMKRGYDSLSTHTWAIAIDLNPSLAPLGEDPTGQPDFIVEAFEKRGFIWGGRWSRPDGMHFQAADGY